MQIPVLKREIGPKGATIIGLGSMLGTGVYIALGLASGLVGYYIFLSILLAGGLAICNGFSSAQLAANHPTSGGSYEFGRIHLGKEIGFVAGWVFIFAKSASAAAASLAISWYIKSYFNIEYEHFDKIVPIVTIFVLGCIIQMGLRLTLVVNTVIVLITVTTLFSIIIFGYFLAHKTGNVQLTSLPKHFSDTPFFTSFLYATSIVFVAFTGYSRIATMAEDMKSPGTTIRFAIFFSIMIVMFLYIGIAFTGLSVLGPDSFSDFSANNVAPLFGIADELSSKFLKVLVSIGAVTATERTMA